MFNASQFAGAGFIPNAQDGATQKGDQDLGVTSDSIRALTIHQLTQAQQAGSGEGGSVFCDGRPIRTVHIVGILASKAAVEHRTELNVYDGTGTISCLLFSSTPDDVEQVGKLEEGAYVSVFGSFKGENTQRPNQLGNITVFACSPVEDHNQVVHHQLQVIFQHMYLTRKNENTANFANNAAMGMGGPAPQMGMQGGMPMQQQGGFGGGVTPDHAASTILSWLQQQNNPAGIHKNAIIAAHSASLGADMVLVGLQALHSNCQIFTTADDDTFAAIPGP